MNIKNGLRRVFGFAAVSGLLAGCGGMQATPSPTIAPPTPAGPDVDVIADVVFATALDGDASDWKLDVYAPPEPGPWPVVLFAHAFGGNRKGYIELSEMIAEKGAVVYTFDWPALVDDVAMMDDGRGVREILETVVCAVRFASATAGDHGGDPERLVFAGHSYGGTMAAWVGLAGEDGDGLWADFAVARGGPPPQVKCAESGGSAHVGAIVGIAGAYNWWNVPRLWEKDPELMALADPFSHIGRNRDLRVRLIVGENDEAEFVDHAAEFNEALAEAGYDTEQTLWDGKHRVPIELTVSTILEAVGD